MADWIAEVDRIDKMLQSVGVPSAYRIKAVANIADILAQADKAKRNRRQLVIEAMQRCGSVRDAAKDEGYSHETFYRELRKSQTPLTS